MLLSNSQIKSIERDNRKALKHPALYLFMFLLALNIQTEVGISGGTTCLSVPGFIPLFSDSQENRRYLNKKKGAVNSLVAKASQLNCFLFNEDLSRNLSPAGIKQLPRCFNFIILPNLISGVFLRKQDLTKSDLLNYLTKRASDYLKGHEIPHSHIVSNRLGGSTFMDKHILKRLQHLRQKAIELQCGLNYRIW